MTCIIKGNDIPKEDPRLSVGMVTDISVYKYSDTVNRIRWTNPEDVIINGVTIAEFGGVNVVISPNHIPENKEDFSLSNGDYSISIGGGSPGGVGFADINVSNYDFESGVTYYIRIFTRTTEGVYNNDPSGIYVYTPLSNILSDNDWDAIIDIANQGNAQDYWSVGDEITLQLSGSYNVACTLQIWDFNHFDKTDGSGKANICFGCKDIYIMEQMNTINSFIGGWVNMPMRNTVMQNIYNSMPSSLQNAIKEVTIKYNPGGTSNIYTCNDKVFIPSINEVGISSPSSPSLGTAFPIFSDDTSRMKYDMRPNGSGDPDFWWTRSAYEYRTNYFLIVYPNGYYDCYTITDTDGAVFCFNI